MSMSDARQKDRATFLATRPVSRETLDILDRYAMLLAHWQRAINLVGPRTLDALWTRHILDSLQLIDLVPEARTFVDLGSGAGFPGLVLAIAVKTCEDAAVTLVESNGKKAAFLQTVVRDLDLPVTVISRRIEDVVPGLAKPDVVTARALAPLGQLLDWCEPLLKTGVVGLFPKGRDLDKELRSADKEWTFDRAVFPSCVEPDSVIIRITNLARR